MLRRNQQGRLSFRALQMLVARPVWDAQLSQAGLGMVAEFKPSLAATTGNEVSWYTSSSFTLLNPLQRAVVAITSAVQAARDPGRADLVAAVGETTGEAAFATMRNRMQRSASGRELLRLRPRMTDATLAHVYTLPANTFGGAYAQFMRKRGFAADDRPPVRYIEDSELAYVAARSREVHDLWHVLFGCPTTVFGELALKGLEFVQTGLPVAAMSVVGAQWRLSSHDRRLLWQEYMPWALKAGASAPDLISLQYERHFQEDLTELRRSWNIVIAPRRKRRVP